MLKFDFEKNEDLSTVSDNAEDIFDRRINCENTDLEKESPYLCGSYQVDWVESRLETEIGRIEECQLSELFDLKEVMQLFEPEIYDTLSIDEKFYVIDMWKDKLSENLDVKHSPEIIISENEEESILGYFLPDINVIVLNSNITHDGPQVRNTIAHEMRHGWQQERISLPEEIQTAYDKALKENFENYVAAEDNYRGYRSQLVEMDAREYANGLDEDMWY